MRSSAYLEMRCNLDRMNASHLMTDDYSIHIWADWEVKAALKKHHASVVYTGWPAWDQCEPDSYIGLPEDTDFSGV